MENNINIESRLQAIEMTAVILAELQGLPITGRSVQEDIIELTAMCLTNEMRN